MSDKQIRDQGTDRRDFLLKLGTGAGICAITVQAAASMRSLVPNVSYDSPTTVKLGPTSEFPEGLKFLPDERLFVFREGNTFHAVSAVCTHLGCTVHAEPLPNPQTVEVDASLPVSVQRLALSRRRRQRLRTRAEAAGVVPIVARGGRRPTGRRSCR